MLIAVQIVELLVTAALFAFGGLRRAEREDREIWTELAAKAASKPA